MLAQIFAEKTTFDRRVELWISTGKKMRLELINLR